MKKKIDQQNTSVAVATSKYLRFSTNKVSRILSQIRGKKYQEAILILKFMPYRGCKNISKLLCSAAANAEHNHDLKKSNLYIQNIFVTQGPTTKRFQARAQGRAFPIHKPTCHITVNLSI